VISSIALPDAYARARQRRKTLTGWFCCVNNLLLDCNARRAEAYMKEE
jgi:hypothetical protein